MECFLCSRTIPDGESFISVNWHMEHADGEFITIEQADSLLTVCMDHGLTRDAVVKRLQGLVDDYVK